MRTIILKKAQLRLFESIAVLLVLFFLFSFGIQYYGAFQINQLEALGDQFSELDAIKISNKIMGSPYLACSVLNSRTGLCIDKYKMLALEDSDVDPNLNLGQTTITIVQVYPETKTVVAYDKAPEEFTNRLSSQFPVTIHDPFTLKNTFGYLEIETYD